MASAAIADNNTAFLFQEGGANSALIDQTQGSDNFAGWYNDPASGVTQRGDENALTILQSGDGNYAGARPGLDFGSILQDGALNTLEITQFGDGNVAMVVDQSSGALSSLLPGTATTNSATLEQSSDSNVVRHISQSYVNAPGAIKNEMEITQTGGDTNRINLARQNGHTNDMVLTQDGTLNRIATARQTGSLNVMTATIMGSENGLGSLAGFAAVTGAVSSTLVQEGIGNQMELTINGRPSIPVPDENQFGISQFGNYNTVNAVNLDSKRANVGIYQNGDENEVQLSAIQGNDNTVGIIQLSYDNYAEVEIVGGNSTGNSFLIDQNGVSNDASVSIDGNNNGDGLVYGDPLTGQALVAASFSANWERGVVRQFGVLNVAELIQIGSGNTFGTLQEGSDNSITGSQNGVNNQVAVLQLGNGNSTTYSQIGTGNNAGIVQ
ncbi:hypothetical protein [Pseudooceanicola nanhaiensis]|uniref:hypothetical protein n=1 Tax=Pseudooceanicola nanhaiensis TaxID=375761 RepID=UPI001CD79587|nr:hypothetical protein [Pseudooceanicola nanhaiensis]MCA0922094.1 hypothetical protein [Pseudooceanicola nanhaiensis]